MATAEFSKFADILSAALSQHHLLVCGGSDAFWTHRVAFLPLKALLGRSWAPLPQNMSEFYLNALEIRMQVPRPPL